MLSRSEKAKLHLSILIPFPLAEGRAFRLRRSCAYSAFHEERQLEQQEHHSSRIQHRYNHLYLFEYRLFASFWWGMS